MQTILWIPIGAVAIGIVVGAIVGARSSGSSARTGALVGLALSLMTTFPLLAIGIATT